jgi:type VI secretion system protein ImpH
VTNIADIRAEPWRYHLFDLLREFERENPDKPRIGDSAALHEEIVRLGQEPFAEFPASNVSRVTEAGGQLKILSRFLGLLGPQGALPLQTTVEAMHFRLYERDEALPQFLDIINQRFIQLFFRAWSDSRPAGQHDRPDDDRFASYVGAVLGIGTEPYRNRDSAPDMEKLALAGLLGPAVESMARIEAMLVYVFGIKALVDPLVGTWLRLTEGDQTSLGGLNAALGQSTITGSAVYSVQDKFRIRIETASLAQFEEFLPSGRHFEHLVDLLYTYLGDFLEYEAQLLIPSAQTKPAAIGSFGRLGWTTWMTGTQSDSDTTLRGDCVFHPAERAVEMRRHREPSKGEH